MEVLPPGDYLVQCEHAEIKPTRSGTGELLKLTLKVVDGQAVGRKLWTQFNVVNQNPEAESIGRGELKVFMLAAGANADKLDDVADLQGLEAVATVKVKTDDWGTKNEVQWFSSLDEGRDRLLDTEKPAASRPAF